MSFSLVLELSQTVRALWRPGNTDMMTKFLGSGEKIIGHKEQQSATDAVIKSEGTADYQPFDSPPLLIEALSYKPYVM